MYSHEQSYRGHSVHPQGQAAHLLIPHPTQTSGLQGPEDIRITRTEDGDYPSRILNPDGYLMPSDLSLRKLYVSTLILTTGNSRAKPE